MPVVSSQTKATIKTLSRADLEKLLLKAASKDKTFYDYLLVNYVDKEYGEQDLYEKAITDLEIIMNKNYKGFAEELQLANMFAACSKRIAEFSKICKNKELELQLVMKVLEVPFSLSTNYFTTCFTNYNYKVGLLVKKAISLVLTKLHPDLKLQYDKTINNYLETLHKTCSYLDCIASLPKSI
jgi:hypothetical protein